MGSDIVRCAYCKMPSTERTVGMSFTDANGDVFCCKKCLKLGSKVKADTAMTNGELQAAVDSAYTMYMNSSKRCEDKSFDAWDSLVSEQIRRSKVLKST